MPDLEIKGTLTLQVELYCADCKRGLKSTVGERGILVAPCPHCLDKAEVTAYRKGYEAAKQEGMYGRWHGGATVVGPNV